MLHVQVICTMPEMFQAMQYGINEKAQSGLIDLQTLHLFDHQNKERIDHQPYGGGCGMLIKADVVAKAIQKAKSKPGFEKIPVSYISPQGTPLKHQHLMQLSQRTHLILLTGRYEGIDHRIYELVEEEWSLGDFILSGGELPAMCMIDGITRLIWHRAQAKDTIESESFYDGLLDYPNYTQPKIWKNQAVPAVLLSGHHQNIVEYRREEALGLTWQKRPDMLDQYHFSQREYDLLAHFLHCYLRKNHE